jgi:hypothetical protein
MKLKKFEEMIKHQKRAIKRIRTKLDTKIKSNKILRDKIKKNLKFINIKSKTNNNQKNKYQN